MWDDRAQRTVQSRLGDAGLDHVLFTSQRRRLEQGQRTGRCRSFRSVWFRRSRSSWHPSEHTPPAVGTTTSAAGPWGDRDELSPPHPHRDGQKQRVHVVVDRFDRSRFRRLAPARALPSRLGHARVQGVRLLRGLLIGHRPRLPTRGQARRARGVQDHEPRAHRLRHHPVSSRGGSLGSWCRLGHQVNPVVEGHDRWTGDIITCRGPTPDYSRLCAERVEDPTARTLPTAYAGAAGSAGNRTATLIPPSGVALTSSMASWSSATAATINSPRPGPLPPAPPLCAGERTVVPGPWTGRRPAGKLGRPRQSLDHPRACPGQVY